MNLGIYGDAHADIILACTDANFLRKVNSFIENLSDEEKVKPDLPVDEEDEGDLAPPEYEECDALTAQEKEDMNKAAEKNLKMLEEKLKMLEAMVEKEEEEKKKKLRKISECPALENEDQEGASEGTKTENLIDIATEEVTEGVTKGVTEDQNQEKTEEPPAEAKPDEASPEVNEATEPTEDKSADAKEATEEKIEPLVTIEGGPEEPEVVEENLKQASKDEEAEKEEEEKRHAEKEKEALAVANQTIEYIESKSGIVSFHNL